MSVFFTWLSPLSISVFYFSITVFFGSFLLVWKICWCWSMNRVQDIGRFSHFCSDCLKDIWWRALQYVLKGIKPMKMNGWSSDVVAEYKWWLVGYLCGLCAALGCNGDVGLGSCGAGGGSGWYWWRRFLISGDARWNCKKWERQGNYESATVPGTLWLYRTQF